MTHVFWGEGRGGGVKYKTMIVKIHVFLSPGPGDDTAGNSAPAMLSTGTGKRQ